MDLEDLYALWYAREAEDAARFYASVFPDSRVDRVTPLLSDTPRGPAGSVKMVDFTLFGQALPGDQRRGTPRLQRCHLDRRAVR